MLSPRIVALNPLYVKIPLSNWPLLITAHRDVLGGCGEVAVPWLPGLRLFWWPNSPGPKLDNHYHVKAAFHLSLGIVTSHFNSSLCFWPIVTIVTPPAHYLSQLCRCLFPSAYPAAAPLSATDCRPLCVICPWVPSTAHLFSSDICIQPLRLCWIWGGNLSSNIIAIIYITITIIIMIKMNRITRFQWTGSLTWVPREARAINGWATLPEKLSQSRETIMLELMQFYQYNMQLMEAYSTAG